MGKWRHSEVEMMKWCVTDILGVPPKFTETSQGWIAEDFRFDHEEDVSPCFVGFVPSGVSPASGETYPARLVVVFPFWIDDYTKTLRFYGWVGMAACECVDGTVRKLGFSYDEPDKSNPMDRAIAEMISDGSLACNVADQIIANWDECT